MVNRTDQDGEYADEEDGEMEEGKKGDEWR